MTTCPKCKGTAIADMTTSVEAHEGIRAYLCRCCGTSAFDHSATRPMLERVNAAGGEGDKYAWSAAAKERIRARMHVAKWGAKRAVNA